MNSSLLSFYFGSLSDAERLKVEQTMLTDTEMLLDYLDLKRQMELATPVVQQPSPALWRRLQAKVKTSKKTQFALVLGISLAAAASLFLFLTATEPVSDGNTPSVQIHTLIDSGHEQLGVSNVL